MAKGKQEVMRMTDRVWFDESRKILVCVDSYDSGVLAGRLCNAARETEAFESLSQFLIKMENLLDEQQMPQSYTQPRSFPAMIPDIDNRIAPLSARKGALATFQIQVIFRQHTSWQGMVVWQERHMEQSFRSVLELILLMDSALRNLHGCNLLKKELQNFK